MRGGLEDQRHRQPGEAEAAGRVRRAPGGHQRLIGAELLVQPGGDLQVQRRRQRQRALRHRQLTRLLQPVHALGAQLVDRPQLMQRPQVPELQPVRAGDGRRAGERLLRLQVALPRHPADHLQGFAHDLGQAAAPAARSAARASWSASARCPWPIATCAARR